MKTTYRKDHRKTGEVREACQPTGGRQSAADLFPVEQSVGLFAVTQLASFLTPNQQARWLF
jgi:hypothetical protein